MSYFSHKWQYFSLFYSFWLSKKVSNFSIHFLLRLFYANFFSCILDIWPEMMFLFQMAHEHLPQAHLAIQRIGSYIQNLNKSLEQETE